MIGLVSLIIYRKRKASMDKHKPNVVTASYNDSNNRTPNTSSSLTLALNRSYNIPSNPNVPTVKPHSDEIFKIKAVKPDGE